MDTENNDFLKLLTKRLAMILLLVMLLISLMGATIFCVNQNGKNQAVLINVLGRQRMLTQKLTKDANRKYAIMQSLESGPLVATPQSLYDKMDILNGSLGLSQKEFDMVMQSLKAGRLQHDATMISFDKSLGAMLPLIQQTDGVWTEFSSSVDILAQSRQIDKQTASALLYINEHNEELLGYCDDTISALIEVQKQSANINIWVVMVLFVVVLLTLIISILHMRKYIISPLNELYSGINQMRFLDKRPQLQTPTSGELEPVIGEISEGFRKLNMLVELIENINQDTSFEDILKYIYLSFSEFIPYSHIGIALLEADGETLEASYGISDPLIQGLAKRLVGIRIPIGETSLSGILTSGVPRVISDLEAYTRGSTAIYNKILLEEGIKSSITLPLKTNNKAIGMIFFSSIRLNAYKQEHIAFLETLSNSIAISFNKNIFIDELLYSSILALVKMAEARDEETGDHLERMKQYSKMIAELLLADGIYADSIPIGFVKEIERFSPMHDIGKVGIRDGVLLKPGKLTHEEYDEMKKHAVYGASILRAAEENIIKQNRSLFKMGIEIAEGHHEKWDGSGYPYGRSGIEIPLSARIVAVADVFDALTSKRPYKESFSFEESFGMIVEGRGKHFDPNIVDLIVKHKEEFYGLYRSFESNRLVVG